METKKIIYKKLSNKIELKSKRIELSVASDIKKGINAGKNQLKKLASAEKILKKAQDTFEDALDKTRGVIRNSNFYNDQVDVINNAEKIAKELGVNPKSIDGFNELLNLMDNVIESEKDLDNIIGQKIS
jgi:transcription initiation factor TFIIIB Brf1 subunit/transcription initiation factor TFIIB